MFRAKNGFPFAVSQSASLARRSNSSSISEPPSGCGLTTLRVRGFVASPALRGPNPIVEAPHPLVSQSIPIDPQQVAPFHGPEVYELRAVEDLVDHLRPFIRRRVGDKLPDFVQCRQSADRVEVQAAQELRV